MTAVNWDEALTKLLTAVDGWDGYGSLAPSFKAIAIGRHVCKSLDGLGLPPTYVGADAMGGVVLEIERGGRRVDIECCNSGRVYLFEIDGDKTHSCREVQAEYASDEAMKFLEATR